MVESRPLEKTLSHVTLIEGIAIITFPIFIALAPTATLLALFPPLVVVVVMQRQFVKGLIETEK